MWLLPFMVKSRARQTKPIITRPQRARFRTCWIAILRTCSPNTLVMRQLGALDCGLLIIAQAGLLGKSGGAFLDPSWFALLILLARPIVGSQLAEPLLRITIKGVDLFGLAKGRNGKLAFLSVHKDQTGL